MWLKTIINRHRNKENKWRFLSQLKIWKCPGTEVPSHYHLDNSQFSLWIILLNGQFCKGGKKKKKIRYFKQSTLLKRPSICPIFFYTGKAHSPFFKKAYSWALIAVASTNLIKPGYTSPALAGHSTVSSSPAKHHPAQHRIINNSTGANQNTFGRKVTISLLWFQGICQMRRIPDYILSSDIWEQTEVNQPPPPWYFDLRGMPISEFCDFAAGRQTG